MTAPKASSESSAGIFVMRTKDDMRLVAIPRSLASLPWIGGYRGGGDEYCMFAVLFSVASLKGSDGLILRSYTRRSTHFG
jgi:hypothetical protein